MTPTVSLRQVSGLIRRSFRTLTNEHLGYRPLPGHTVPSLGWGAGSLPDRGRTLCPATTKAQEPYRAKK